MIIYLTPTNGLVHHENPTQKEGEFIFTNPLCSLKPKEIADEDLCDQVF